MSYLAARSIGVTQQRVLWGWRDNVGTDKLDSRELQVESFEGNTSESFSNALV
jgi:hypothetical protein